MPNITLPDGATKDFNKSVDIDEIAFSISKGLAKATVAGFVNEELVDAVKDAESPGNVGDLINTNTQIEYLAMVERAFRARHTMSFPRGVAHASARRHGQGGDKGPLKFSVMKYLEDLQKMSAGSV